ncbi:MAG: hypothetical protein FWD31_10080, partial [Planctomycetaceae bacterium]|nr:hypothetical protein [Planctomycetaceae bacterium]
MSDPVDYGPDMFRKVLRDIAERRQQSLAQSDLYAFDCRPKADEVPHEIVGLDPAHLLCGSGGVCLVCTLFGNHLWIFGQCHCSKSATHAKQFSVKRGLLRRVHETCGFFVQFRQNIKNWSHRSGGIFHANAVTFDNIADTG